MRLVPGQPVRGQRPDVQPLDGRARHALRDERRVVGESRGREGVADPLQHICLRVFYHARVREQELLVRQRVFRRVAPDDRRQQPRARGPPSPAAACRATPASRRARPGVFSPSSTMLLIASATSGLANALTSQFGSSHGRGLHAGELLRQPVGDRVGVLRRPDRAGVHARPPAVGRDRFHQQVEVLLPVVGLVFAEDDLASSRCRGSRRGGRSCTGPCCGRRRTPCSGRTAGGCRADPAWSVGRKPSTLAGMPALRNACRTRNGVHGSSRPGLQQQRNLERERRHPQRMHAGRVRRQHRPEDVGRRVERLHPPARGRVPLVERFDGSARGSARRSLPRCWPGRTAPCGRCGRRTPSALPVVADRLRMYWSNVSSVSPQGRVALRK